MGKSADSVCSMYRQIWDNRALSNSHANIDPRFCPVPWDDEVAKPGSKLTIGWYVYLEWKALKFNI